MPVNRCFEKQAYSPRCMPRTYVAKSICCGGLLIGGNPMSARCRGLSRSNSAVCVSWLNRWCTNSKRTCRFANFANGKRCGFTGTCVIAQRTLGHFVGIETHQINLFIIQPFNRNHVLYLFFFLVRNNCDFRLNGLGLNTSHMAMVQKNKSMPAPMANATALNRQIYLNIPVSIITLPSLEQDHTHPRPKGGIARCGGRPRSIL